LLGRGAAAQLRADPGTALNGKVAVRVFVTLSDEQTPYYPVRSLQLRFFKSASDSVVALTDEAGAANTLLAPGEYRLVSGRVTEWNGRRYTWSIPVTVREGIGVVDLTARNAVVGGELPQPVTGPVMAQSRAGVSAPLMSPNETVTDLIAKGSLDGKVAANSRGTGSYFAGGVGYGVLLGLIGTGIGYVLAGHDNVNLPTNQPFMFSDSSETYRRAFTQAYADRVKAKRKSSALAGGLTGTAIIVVVVASIVSSQGY
jgi:hypothetical protein